MKGFDKLFVGNALRGSSTMSFNPKHYTTLNIGEIVPLFTMPVIPRDKVKIKANYFARLAPLVVPSYVDCYLKTQTFFVPYHQVMDGADSYINGQPKYKGNNNVLRYITMSDIFHLYNSSLCEDFNAVATADDYDFCYKSTSSSAIHYAKFTPRGRFVYKVMRSLGYQLPQAVGSEKWTNDQNIKLNALPLLCYFKAFNDYFTNSNRYNSDNMTRILYGIKVNKDLSANVYSNGHIPYQTLITFFQNVLLCYDDDYFTTCWESPITPLSAIEETRNSIYDNYSSNAGAVAGNNPITFNNTNDIVYRQTVPGGTSITARGLHYLEAFEKYVRRNHLAGSKDVEMIFSRFGIHIDDYRTRYAYHIGSSCTPLQIGDITATANSSYQEVEMAIGDYVGKGIMSGGDNVDFDSSDFGHIITLGYITVKPLYGNGWDREVLKNDPLQFYNPEFDGMQAFAISKNEVDAQSWNYDQPEFGKVFGFAPNYHDYRFLRDRVTGDFALRSMYQPWHFNRNFKDIVAGGQLSAQSESFMHLPLGGGEYNRIFTEDTGFDDKFLLACNFDVSAKRPMKSVSGSYDLGDGDIALDNGGSTLN